MLFIRYPIEPWTLAIRCYSSCLVWL